MFADISNIAYSLVYYLNVSLSGRYNKVREENACLFLLSITRYYVVSVRRNFLFFWLLFIGCVLLRHSLCLPLFYILISIPDRSHDYTMLCANLSKPLYRGIPLKLKKTYFEIFLVRSIFDDRYHKLVIISMIYSCNKQYKIQVYIYVNKMINCILQFVVRS